MTLPLPFTLGDEDDPAQGNFDEIKKQFPLSRRHMKIESPHVVGAAGEPAFQGTWANTNAGHQVARFWKDPMGLVHLEGAISAGTINTTAFTLPAGYRPSLAIRVATSGNGAFATLQINPDGTVVPLTGTATVFILTTPPFKQEQ